MDNRIQLTANGWWWVDIQKFLNHLRSNSAYIIYEYYWVNNPNWHKIDQMNDYPQGAD